MGSFNELRVKSHPRLDLKNSGGIISGLDCMQFNLSSNRAPSSTIGLSICIDRIEGSMLAGNLVLESYLIVVVQLGPGLLLDALQFPVNFIVDFVFVYAVHHGQQFSSQPELRVFRSQKVAHNDAGNGNSVATQNRIRIDLGISLIRLTDLPIRPQIVMRIASHRDYSPPAEEDVV